MVHVAERRVIAPLALLFAALLLMFAACDVGGPKTASIIPGPTVPSPILTSAPYIWDTRADLDLWAHNAVSRGQMTVQGIGPEAVINFDRPASSWVLRGPDLEPPAEAIRTVRIRYRWEPDPGLAPGASRTGSMTAYFELARSSVEQPAAYAYPVTPSDGWKELEFTPGSFRGVLDLRYVYITSSGFNPGILQIDRIELVQ